MPTVRYRKGAGGDGPRISFAFFLAGALVVLVAVFVIGIQVGRVIEKEKLVSPPAGEDGTQTVRLSTTSPDSPSAGAGGQGGAAGVEVVPPKEPPPLTFPETLEKQEPVLVSLAKEKGEKAGKVEPAVAGAPRKDPGKGVELPEGAGREAPKGAEVFLQAGVFTDKYGAETVRKKIRRAGFQSTLRPATGKGGKSLHKVLAGPFPDRAAARAAEKKLKGAGVDVYLPKG